MLWRFYLLSIHISAVPLRSLAHIKRIIEKAAGIDIDDLYDSKKHGEVLKASDQSSNKNVATHHIEKWSNQVQTKQEPSPNDDQNTEFLNQECGIPTSEPSDIENVIKKIGMILKEALSLEKETDFKIDLVLDDEPSPAEALDIQTVLKRAELNPDEYDLNGIQANLSVVL